MKATYSTGKVKGFNRNHRKENNFLSEYLVIQPKYNLLNESIEMKQVISLRIYGTNAMNYACLWVYANDYKSGSGSAGGYGYHRPSAAAEEAINAAGYSLDESISGVGESAIKKALNAICKLEGFKDCQIFEAHP